MFNLQTTPRQPRPNPVEVRYKQVEEEIHHAAQRVSRRHRILAQRLKHLALSRSSDLMDAMQSDDERERIARIDDLIGKGVRLSPEDAQDPNVLQLLASASELSWADLARRSN